MPFVTVRITREGATREQKAQVIAGVTDLLVRVLGKEPATTMVVIDEVDIEAWGIEGLPVPEFRARKAAAARAGATRAVGG
jgi:4-oxalocrotonate tautomerase